MTFAAFHPRTNNQLIISKMTSPVKKIAKIADDVLGTSFASPSHDLGFAEPPHPEASPGKRSIVEGPKKNGKMSFQHVAVLSADCMTYMYNTLVSRAGQVKVEAGEARKVCQIWSSNSNER